MDPVDYDAIAPVFDRRYAENDYRPVADELMAFIGSRTTALDVGCGTGYWTAAVAAAGTRTLGIDPSAGMLRRAQRRLGEAGLVLGVAERLPFRRHVFDRLFCINSFHHFRNPERFAAEAFRVLRSEGGLMVIGLDPHGGSDRWWLYDYFPTACSLDRERYPSAGDLRAVLRGAGFARCETVCAQHTPVRVAAQEALDSGRLAKHSTSQLTLLSDDEYAGGMTRLRRDIAGARARGREHMLEADLRIFATTAWVR